MDSLERYRKEKMTPLEELGMMLATGMTIAFQLAITFLIAMQSLRQRGRDFLNVSIQIFLTPLMLYIAYGLIHIFWREAVSMNGNLLDDDLKLHMSILPAVDLAIVILMGIRSIGFREKK